MAVYKGCTRDAHRVNIGKSDEHPVGIPCTPLVHSLMVGLYVAGMTGVKRKTALGIGHGPGRTVWERREALCGLSFLGTEIGDINDARLLHVDSLDVYRVIVGV